jgi:hypothetical protein
MPPAASGATFRGAVVIGEIKRASPTQLTVSPDLDARLITRIALYWDQFVCPQIGGFDPLFKTGDDLKPLLDAGLLATEPVQVNVAAIVPAGFKSNNQLPFGPGEYWGHIVTAAQFALARQLTKQADQPWSAVQFGEDLFLERMNNREDANAIVVVRLVNCLPVPGPTVPLRDLLDFKTSYAAELTALRNAFSALRQQIAAGGDANDLLMTCKDAIESHVGELCGAIGKSQLHFEWCTLRVFATLSPPHRIIDTIPPAGISAEIDWGPAIGASIILKAHRGMREVKLPDTSRDFTYVYQNRRTLSH